MEIIFDINPIEIYENIIENQTSGWKASITNDLEYWALSDAVMKVMGENMKGIEKSTASSLSSVKVIPETPISDSFVTSLPIIPVHVPFGNLRPHS